MNCYPKDLIGIKFGFWEVVSLEEKNRYGGKWLCRCSCGKTKSVNRQPLVSGRSLSCGCLRKRVSSEKAKKVLLGKIFGHLTVIKECGVDKNRRIIWECLCECGNTKRYNSNHLTRKKDPVISCGQSCKERCESLHTCGDITYGKFENIKHGANTRNLEFNITIEHMWELFLKQNRKCALSDIELVFNTCGVSGGTASLDRIDSSKGYVKGNVQWVHKDINRMKYVFAQDYFIDICCKIADKYKAPGEVEK